MRAALPPLPLAGEGRGEGAADRAVAALAAQARAELASFAYPDRPWLPGRPHRDGRPVHDVLVIGAGQSGLGIAARLRLHGVTDVAVLDRAPAGREGVWDSFARMPELRTPKRLNGLDLGLPSLSVERWFIATHGEAAWQRLERIPRSAWMDYLRWYRATLAIAVENEAEVVDIRPADATVAAELLAVDVVTAGVGSTRLARLVVLATGHDGGGTWSLPGSVAAAVPPERRSHACGEIDFAALGGARVGILGHGASAFDNAVAALLAGAASVDVCFRRAALPRVNPHRAIETAGLMTHYPTLADATRWRIARHFRRVDQPPPRASFDRACAAPNFALHAGCPWTALRWTGTEIEVDTPRGRFAFDHVICATGQVFDLSARPELRTIAPRVARWRDRYAPAADEADAVLGAHPYLGAHYQFQPRDPADAWIARVFAFNTASYVSHGPHSTSISGHKHALPRLVHGLTERLFLDREAGLVADLERYDEVELDLPPGFEDGGATRRPLREAA